MAQTYRIAADLRRCCWYCMLASLALAAPVPLVSVEDRRIAGLIGAAVFFGAVFGYCALALVWRLEVVDTGLVRRSWLGRDLWTWDDFASGRVRKGPLFLLRDPRRPWWRRKLDVGLPSWRGATAEELSEFISRHAPAERIEIAIDGDYAATPRLAEKRLAALRKHERELRSFWPIFGGVFAVAVTVLLAAEGTDALFTAIALGCFWLAMAGGFTFIARRHIRQRLEQFERSAVPGGRPR